MLNEFQIQFLAYLSIFLRILTELDNQEASLVNILVNTSY